MLPAQRQVRVGGQPAALGTRGFDLLLTLIEHRDRSLSKDELMALVWPNMVVEENNLTVQISALRKLLGAEAITTIAGRGYRFTAPLAQATPDEMSPTRLVSAHASENGNALTEMVVKPGKPVVGQVPATLNSLIGRAAAVQETLQLLETARCLTFTGAGGAGKTRLAQELAVLLQAEYERGVWWVGLASLRDPKMLLAAVSHAFGVQDPTKHAFQNIVERLQGGTALLVLDNCEHLIEDCAELGVQLLRALPKLQLLATSRESLRIAGEIAWAVPALEVPGDSEVRGSVDDLSRVPSVQLLVERIRQNNAKFTLTNHNAASLVQISRRLEGLPLALELIAAQVGVQTLQQIAAHLDNSLQMMTDGHRGGIHHHLTMSATVQWSYDLLSPAAQSVFARLSAFAGGWTLAGAQALCARPDLSDLEVAELIARLRRCSMVLAHEADGVMRFRMLEPIRQFAYAKLESSGLADALGQQLLAWYVKLCDAIIPELAGPGQAKGYKTLTAEIDNLRAALTWSKRANLEQGLHLAASLWRFWQVKGYAKELLIWFDETLPLAQGVSIAVRANAYNSAGIMARTCGLYADAIHLHGVALTLRREQGDRHGVARALNNLAVVARDQGDHSRVEQYCRESMAIAQGVGDKNLRGLGLIHLGTALRGQGKVPEAEESFKQSFRIFSELGDKRVLANLHGCLGELAQAKTDWTEAQRCFEASLEINEELDDFWGLGLSTCNLASLQYDMQDFAGALTRLRQSFSHYSRAGAKHGLDRCFELLAKIAHQRGEHRRAAWCWGVVEQIQKDTGAVTTPAEQARREQALLLLKNQMTTPAFQSARAAGQQVSLEQAFTTLFSDPDLTADAVRPGLFLVTSSRA